MYGGVGVVENSVGLSCVVFAGGLGVGESPSLLVLFSWGVSVSPSLSSSLYSCVYSFFHPLIIHIHWPSATADRSHTHPSSFSFPCIHSRLLVPRGSGHSLSRARVRVVPASLVSRARRCVARVCVQTRTTFPPDSRLVPQRSASCRWEQTHHCSSLMHHNTDTPSYTRTRVAVHRSQRYDSRSIAAEHKQPRRRRRGRAAAT